jgi:hypothetical protein
MDLGIVGPSFDKGKESGGDSAASREVELSRLRVPELRDMCSERG